MANNKMYENYLMHYRTKGSKNGYTKYPGKYTPVGEKAIDSTGLNFNRYKNLQRFGAPKDGGEGPAMVADKAEVAVARAEHDRNNRRAEARKKITPVLSGTQAVGMRGIGAYNDKKKYEETRMSNKQAADARRIAGGNVGGGTTAVQRMIKSQEDIHNVTSKLYNAANAIANPRARSKESQQFTNQKMAEARRIKGGSGISAAQRQREAEARRIAGGNPYVNQREENRKAAEQRRIAGGSGISASQRQKEAEARRIAGGSQGTITTAEAKRKNINDWYGNQVRGGNQSAAEARRIKGGTHGATTTAQAAAKNAESEKKKKKLKNVLKALLKSNSRGISRFF